MTDGRAFEDAFAMIGIVYLAEMTLYQNETCETFSYTIQGSIAQGRVVRYLNMSESCCDIYFDEGMLTNTAHRQMVVVNITNPAWPNFHTTVVLSMSNETVVIEKPSTASIGDGYNITYEYVQDDQSLPNRQHSPGSIFVQPWQPGPDQNLGAPTYLAVIMMHQQPRAGFRSLTLFPPLSVTRFPSRCLVSSLIMHLPPQLRPLHDPSLILLFLLENCQSGQSEGRHGRFQLALAN
jgi:hypothetical protein